MKNTRTIGGRKMKKCLTIVMTLALLSCFMVSAAHAMVWGYELGNPILGPVVISPDANSGPGTIVGVAPSGTVTIGTFSGVDDTQPVGFYGAGVSLAAFSGAEGFLLAAAPNLLSWDSADYDLFYIGITKGGYIWETGSVWIGGEIWGGTTEDALDGLNEPWSIFSTVMVTPASDYYYNIALETTSDTALPSWGSMGDVAIAPIPEPASLLLLGSGLLGLIGVGKAKKRKV